MDAFNLLQLGFGFWPSKVLLSAVKLGVFTSLTQEPLTGEQLQQKLGLHPRATYDFLDTLVALKLLEREGTGASARYSNTAETGQFLDREKSTYVGGILETVSYTHLTLPTTERV